MYHKIKDYHILISGILLNEPKEFINNLRSLYKDAIIQVIDINTILDEEHIKGIIKQVLEAYERNILISNKIETEILLRIACTNQIHKALEFASAKNNSLAALIIVTKDPTIIDNIVNNYKLNNIEYSDKRTIMLLEYHNLKDAIINKIRSMLLERANLIY
jgi:tRNA threonylcarbamoyladenosine modification (KEOPS) complex Cgi121 subunit